VPSLSISRLRTDGEIIAALIALAAELQRRRASADTYVVGGAAISLAFDERRATRDIDAVFEPKNVVNEAAAAVAPERGLPAGWLNDAVKGSSPAMTLRRRRSSTCLAYAVWQRPLASCWR